MANYLVTIPIAGSITHSVEANSEEEAIKLALDMDPREGDLTWEPFEKLVEGNICHAPLNEIEVQLD